MIELSKKGMMKYGTLLFLLVIFMFIISLAVKAPFVQGVNSTNVLSKVNISGQPPRIYNITVNDNISIIADEIDLVPGATTEVICNVTAFDSDGFADIVNGTINATLYVDAAGPVSTLDDNSRYFVSDCTTNCSQISATNVSCLCFFYVEYYANATTWRCNATVSDFTNISTTNVSSVTTINSLLALSVASELDFGDVPSTKVSSEFEFNITNFGNININTSVWGYANTPGDNLSMNCTVGNISLWFEKYATSSGLLYNNMINLTQNATLVALNFSQRTNDTGLGSSANSTFWRLQVESGAQGDCNGTIVFEASAA